MKYTSLGFLKACTLSVALLGSAAIVAAIAMPDAAFAKSGNGNGNGNGGGNGNGNSGGNGNGNGGKAAGDSAGNAAGGKSAAASSATKTKAKKKSLLDEFGVSASDLGALNAAHANENALKNASPNSRVGRIAAYRDAVLAGEAMQAELDAKQAELDGMSAPTRTSEEIQADIDAALLADPLADVTDLQAEYDNAEDYETLSGEVAGLTQQLEDQPAVERGLIEAAANKPVTDAVVAAVKALLGL